MRGFHLPALLFALALLAGTGASVPSASAMGHESVAPSHACCHGKADPCATPCPSGDEQALDALEVCCEDGDHAPGRSAVAAPVPPGLDPVAVSAPLWLAAVWRVSSETPPARLRPGGAQRQGPPRPPVRSHLAVSVLLI